jgi:hypothetical protein
LPCTQKELDAIVAQRFEWVARFASAVSHEVGNIVLFAEAADPDAALSDDVREFRKQYAYLIQHFRELLRTLGIWKTAELQRGRQASVTVWWRAQGGFIRQFVRRTVPVTLTSSVAENRVIDPVLLTRAIASLIVAVDLQSEKLERLALEAAVEGHDGKRVCIAFKATPARSDHSFLIPSAVKELMNDNNGRITVSTDAEDTLLVFGIDAVPQGAGGGGAAGANTLFR